MYASVGMTSTGRSDKGPVVYTQARTDGDGSGTAESEEEETEKSDGKEGEDWRGTLFRRPVIADEVGSCMADASPGYV